MSTQHVSLTLENAVGTPAEKSTEFNEFLTRQGFCQLTCHAFKRSIGGEPEAVAARVADLLLTEAKRLDVQFQAVLQVGNSEAKLISSACPY